MDETLWGLMTIVGPIILLGLLLWLVFKRKSNVTTRTTEQATHDQYENEEQRRREGTDDL